MTTIMRCSCLHATLLAFAIGSRMQAQESPSVRLRLMRDTVLAGVRCAATGRAYAVLHPNGALDECPLASDSVMAGHLLPRLTWIRLRQDATLGGAWLPRDTELQGIPCKGAGYKGWSVRFHPGGRLAVCFLSREATIDGIPCRAGAFLTELSGTTQVALHPNGRLQGCRLAGDITRGGVTIRSGRRITLSPDGALVVPPPAGT